MTSGDSLFTALPVSNQFRNWLFVAFTSGSVEPTANGDGTDVIWGDTSDASARLEYLSLESGTWGGGDAAGYMLLSHDAGVAWSSGENFTQNSSTPANDGTLTGVPVTCAATPDQNTPGDDRLDFDPTVNEIAVFKLVMPRHYDGGGLTITVGVAASTATTGDMSWAIFLMSVSDNADDLDVKNFADPQVNQAVDAPTTLGNVRYFTITFTDGAQMDSIAAGEPFFLMIMRDAQDTTNDDMAGDAEKVFLEGQET
jgi:hypothetical protein